MSHPAIRSPVLVGLRSVLIPGWGELSVRGSRRDRILILLSLVMANVVVGAFVVLGPLEVLSELVDPGALVAVMAINLLLGLARLVSTGHSWRLAGGRSLMVALLLGALVLGPHLAVGWFTFQMRETLVTVFAPPLPLRQPHLLQVSDTTPTPGATVPTTIPDSSPASSTAPATVTVDMSAVTRTTPDVLGHRLNLLLLGGDAGPGRAGLRTDTVMVASVDTLTGDTAIFGLPRNLGELRLSDGAPVPGRILNEVYGWATRYQPERFPGPHPGALAVADVAATLTGLNIDYFVMLDLTGFADVVNVFGGVSLNVPTPVDGPLYDTVDGSYTMVRIPAGDQILDGDLALAYARARYGSNDYVRMGRQRCILAAMAVKIDLFSTLARLPSLLGVLEQNVTTNFPIDLLPDLVRLGTRIRQGDTRVIGFGPDWGLGVNERGQLIPDVTRIRKAVEDTLRNPSGSVAPSASVACA